MKRVLTKSQAYRSKLIGGLFLFMLSVTFTCNYVAAEMKPFDAKYVWQGDKYPNFKRI